MYIYYKRVLVHIDVNYQNKNMNYLK